MVRRPCAALWKTPVIQRNGDVTVCCKDIGLKLKVGNIRKQCLDDIWCGKAITKLRLLHIQGEFYALDICYHCNNLDSPQITDQEIVTYLKFIDMEDLVGPYLKRVRKQY